MRGPAEVWRKTVCVRRAPSTVFSTSFHGAWLPKRVLRKFSNAAICVSLMLSAKPGMIGLRSPSTGGTPASTILARLRGSGPLIAVLSARLMPP